MKCKKICFLSLALGLVFGSFTFATNRCIGKNAKIYETEAARPPVEDPGVVISATFVGLSKTNWSEGETLTTKDVKIRAEFNMNSGSEEVWAFDLPGCREYMMPAAASFSSEPPEYGYVYEEYHNDSTKNSIKILGGTNTYTLYVYSKRTETTEKHAVSFEITAEVTAEEVAKEFNDNIDLYCNGGINPVLTGENSVSSTWATASEQYSQLSDNEQKILKGEVTPVKKVGEITFQSADPSKDDVEYNGSDTLQTISSGLNFLRTDDAQANNSGFCFRDAPDDDKLWIGDGNGEAQFCIFGLNLDEFSKKNAKFIRCYYSLFQEYGYGTGSLSFGFYDDKQYWPLDYFGENYYKYIDYSEVSHAYVDIPIPYDAAIELETTISFQLYHYHPYFTFYFEKMEIYGEANSLEITEMLSKYDYLYEKYGNNPEMNLDNFLGRNITPNPVRKNIFSISEVDNSNWIIVAVSLIGLTAIGALIFYKKRKEY